MKLFFTFLTAYLLIFNISYSDSYKVIYDFDSTGGKGINPIGGMIALDKALYGVTQSGGAKSVGSIFSINPDGNGYKTIYSFKGNIIDGSYPYGGLLAVGDYLFGLTIRGGTSNLGTIYKIRKDGKNYEILHSFEGGADGTYPQSSLIISDNMLYGVTLRGGSNDSGTVFRISTLGIGYQVIHSFQSDIGAHFPGSSLYIFEGKLYGTSLYGGLNYNFGNGVLFRLNTDGSEFENIFGYDINNSQPYTPVISDGKFLYGATCCGHNRGSVYRIDKNGKNYQTLHTFPFGDKIPASIYNYLLLHDDYIYGMTMWGGEADTGTIFRLNIKDTSFSVIHHFGTLPYDGYKPYGEGLIFYNNHLYGVTNSGGKFNGGTIFAFTDSILADSCNEDSFFKYDFNNTTDIQFNYSANLVNGAIRLVPALILQSGSVIYKKPLTVSNGFVTDFSFRFSQGYNAIDDGSPVGADGIAFLIQTNSYDKIIGIDGGGIGYAYISNSLAVEFDSYKNDNDMNDPNGSHIAVFTNWKKPNSADHNSSALKAVTSDIPVLKADSTTYYSRIEYLAKDKKLNIYFGLDNNFSKPVLTIDSIDLSKNLDLIEGTKLYAGFTSATGTSYQNTDLLSWTFCSKSGNSITNSIGNDEFKNEFSITPNPSDEYIQINVPVGMQLAVPKEIEIYSIEGILMQSTSPQPSPFSERAIQIDVSGFVPGVYFVKIGDRIQRFIKM